MSLRTGPTAQARQQTAKRPAFNVPLREVPDKLLDLYGFRQASPSERQEFAQAISKIPDEIKSLWRGEKEVILAIHKTDEVFGRHQSNWVMLGSDSMEHVARHEFTHHIVSQSHIESQLGKYNAGDLFDHAGRAGNWIQQRNEDLTMALDSFHPNKEQWARRMMGEFHTIMRGGQFMTEAQARDKVQRVSEFFGVIGEW
jgi:hypothetical protein